MTQNQTESILDASRRIEARVQTPSPPPATETPTKVHSLEPSQDWVRTTAQRLNQSDWRALDLGKAWLPTLYDEADGSYGDHTTAHQRAALITYRAEVANKLAPCEADVLCGIGGWGQSATFAAAEALAGTGLMARSLGKYQLTKLGNEVARLLRNRCGRISEPVRERCRGLERENTSLKSEVVGLLDIQSADALRAEVAKLRRKVASLERQTQDAVPRRAGLVSAIQVENARLRETTQRLTKQLRTHERALQVESEATGYLREHNRRLIKQAGSSAAATKAAIDFAIQFGGIDGAHHKTWVIDQMVRALAGDGYDRIVADAKAGEDGPDTYTWDEGRAP